HRRLARGVGGSRGNPDDARARGDVDDRAGAGLPHGADGVLAAEEHAVQVGLVDRAPGLERGVFRVVRDGLALEPGDAGIVDDDVQPAMGAQDRLGGDAPCLLVAHVHAHRARRFAKRRRDGAGAGRVDVGDVDRRAFGRERPGDRLADAARGPGDQGNLVLEAQAVFLQAGKPGNGGCTHARPRGSKVMPRRGPRPRRYSRAGWSAASGALKLPPYIPERSKQHTRFLPLPSMSIADSRRLPRVSAFLPEVIHAIQSRRATVVVASQVSFAAGLALSASRRSGGTLGSGSFAAGAIASATVSPGSAPAASRSARGTLSQWLPSPSGSSTASNGLPANVPSTATIARVGSCALASAGSTRNVQVAFFGCAGRARRASNSIVIVRVREWA